jgi:hypothetical protein
LQPSWSIQQLGEVSVLGHSRLSLVELLTIGILKALKDALDDVPDFVL